MYVGTRDEREINYIVPAASREGQAVTQLTAFPRTAS